MLDMTLIDMRLVRSELTRELRAINDDARANVEFAAMFCAIPSLANYRLAHARKLQNDADHMCKLIAELSDAIFSHEATS
jgi:hypothetical protein